MPEQVPERPALESLIRFPLVGAVFGRRARRFGLGMEIPSGPLAYRSRHDPLPLTELEQSILVAAATGASGWSLGVPFGPRTPDSHAEFTVRFTGRTAPTAAGIGSPMLFYTDDDGCYGVATRDLEPEGIRQTVDDNDGYGRLLEMCRANTVTLTTGRLDIPSEPPHILPPNLWWANRPGSTLFMPVGDTSEEFLGILGLMMRHGVMVVDQDTGGPAGDLQPYIRSGLLDSQKRFPLAELLADVNDSMCLELAFIGHNIVLMLQALGLGGLYFNGMDGLSALGAYPGVKGLGFRSVEDERWITPNVVGLDGVYEGLCPPYYPDMRSAVEAFVARKFGPGGAYDTSTPGPWNDPTGVKGSVSPYSDEFVDCMATIAQYVYDKYGKFPGTRSTVVLPGFVQAHHIDTGFYDIHYQEGSYLPPHAEHLTRWH